MTETTYFFPVCWRGKALPANVFVLLSSVCCSRICATQGDHSPVWGKGPELSEIKSTKFALGVSILEAGEGQIGYFLGHEFMFIS